MASVSKVVGTTSAVLLLVQEGLLDVNKPVASVIPEFGVNEKSKITFRNLLAHDSGLIAFRPYHQTCTEPSEVMTAIYNEKLVYETGAKSVYSDLSMILVAEAIYRLTGNPLEVFLQGKVFSPLGMNHSGYFRRDTPTKIDRNQCAPTEKVEPWRRSLHLKRYGQKGTEALFGKNPEFIQGEVHDPTATVLDGVAGHAGLFSTLGDLCSYMENFIAAKPKLFDPTLVQAFVKQQSPKSSRALGWDTRSPEGSSSGKYFGPRSFGHTGYTGTSIWCDPDANMFVVLLTNRVHPTSENTKLLAIRPKFHDTAWIAVKGGQ